MSDDMEKFMFAQRPTPERPLQGLTVLVVEDSRFASEAIRLLCLRSGARIRRADTLAAAHRHLRVYRPTVIIADVGLPDGSGLELLEELANASPRVPVLLGMSGDDTAEEAVLKAGADVFLAKPVENLAVFQQTILALLPAGPGSMGLRQLPSEVVEPDPIALQDDLAHVAKLMRADTDQKSQSYIAQFLGGLARSAHDDALERTANDLASPKPNLSKIADELENRLTNRSSI